ncbi:hypothetical protein [Rhodococcus koreensis]
MPGLLPEELFEDGYRRRFEALVHDRGLVIDFKRDRSALDIGIALTHEGSLELSGVKVWFQLKGLHASSLPEDKLRDLGHAPVSVRVDHLRFWYASPEAIYLVVYVESTGQFLAEDVREIVDRRWGVDFLSNGELNRQDTVTVHLGATAVLDAERLGRMLAHRSMRIDGPAFRGRPLGHRLDPLRSQLDVLPTEAFRSVVDALLDAHGFRHESDLDISRLMRNPGEEGTAATLSIGTLHSTYEWIFQMSVEFGWGPDSSPRAEGQVFSAFGRVGVLVQSEVCGYPEPAQDATEFLDELRAAGIDQILVFANAPDHKILGSYRVLLGDLCPVPQGVSSLAYNVLTCTLVYLDHRDQLRWALRAVYNTAQ